MAAQLLFMSITIGLPVLFAVYAYVNKRLSILLLGALAFIGSQILFRIPLLKYVAEQSTTFQLWQVTKPLLMMLVLAATAGIVEELARWLLMRYCVTAKTYTNGLLFGLGHGGVEALLLVGIPMLTHLQVIPMLPLLLSSFERLCAMLVHISLSIIVLTAVRRKAFRYCVYAMLVHTSVNFIVVYVASNYSAVVAEVVLSIATVLCGSIAFVNWRRNQQYEKMEYINM